jgi:hypothetical protein
MNKQGKSTPEGLAAFLEVLKNHTWLLAFGFGVAFIILLLMLAIAFPNPTAFQYLVFRIVLSLAAAGFAGVIPGFIELKIKPNAKFLIHAGGALAVFVMVYRLEPAKLILNPEAPTAQSKLTQDLHQSQLGRLVIDEVDAVKDNKYIVNFSPPKTVQTAHLRNVGYSSLYLSPIGKIEPFYTTLLDQNRSLEAGDERLFHMILTGSDAPTKTEYSFTINDGIGGTYQIIIHPEGDWLGHFQNIVNNFKQRLIETKAVTSQQIYSVAKEVTENDYKDLKSGIQEAMVGTFLVSVKENGAAEYAFREAKKTEPQIVERLTIQAPPMIVPLTQTYDANDNDDTAAVTIDSDVNDFVPSEASLPSDNHSSNSCSYFLGPKSSKTESIPPAIHIPRLEKLSRQCTDGMGSWGSPN